MEFICIVFYIDFSCLGISYILQWLVATTGQRIFQEVALMCYMEMSFYFLYQTLKSFLKCHYAFTIPQCFQIPFFTDT